MNVDAGSRQPPGLGAMESWELQQQDSFGGNFSFSQDYPMLSTSNSNEQREQHLAHPQPGMQRKDAPPALESRNQSFEGGHYHGPFVAHRNDSMMSYEGSRSMGAPPYDHRQVGGYQGQFPPHAPSWGSAGSFQQQGGHGHGYSQYHRDGPYPPMMRNFSNDGSGRVSPPGSMRMIPPGFQPPPEFRAPPSMLNKGGSQMNAHIMTSPYAGGQKQAPYGPLGWSKEEDDSLTEVMKKYKSPRDWEPIAKELGRERT
jgi:hypothetical protein